MVPCFKFLLVLTFLLLVLILAFHFAAYKQKQEQNAAHFYHHLDETTEPTHAKIKKTDALQQVSFGTCCGREWR
jgi:hypothetical protein